MDTLDEAELALGEQVEVAPGVIVERRSFLSLSAAAFGVTGSGWAAARPAPREGPLSFEEFLDQVLPVARELKRDTSPLGEDRYLYTLASFAVRLADVPAPQMRPSGQGEGVTIGANWGGDPFVVLHWKMAPGSSIRLHAHTYGNVVTIGLEGRARVRNFETLEEPRFDDSGPVRLRQTNDQLLVAGRINLVPLAHGFVHGFEAGAEGARGLDITTRLHEKRATPYLDLVGDIDEAERLFEGRWTD